MAKLNCHILPHLNYKYLFCFHFRYFAHDCRTHFPGIRKGAPDNLNEVVCQERYSRIVPSTQGTVIYRVLPPNINIHRADFLPYSKPVQDLLKTTNIRIVMTALHTLGDENLNLRDNKVSKKATVVPFNKMSYNYCNPTIKLLLI